MKDPKNARGGQLRQRVAQEAARVMVEGGIRDYQLAKRKALERLHLDERHPLPRNDEIEAAIGEYQRLFRADIQPRMLEELRAVAIRVMRSLERFQPRVVGAVLAGTADEHSEVCLHVFADTPEEIEFFLMDRGIRYEAGERRLRVAGEAWRRLPAFRILVEEIPVELVAFCERARREVPLSPVDGRPERRASLAALEALAAG